MRISDWSSDVCSSDLNIYDKHRHEEPFARDDRIAEAVLDLDVEPRRIEDVVDQVFELHAVDVVERVGGDDLHVRQQKGRVQSGIGDALGDIAAGDADLVQHLAVGCDGRVV